MCRCHHAPWLVCLTLAFALTLSASACGDDDAAGNNNNNQTNGVCGDGNLDPQEECDDGALNSDASPDACRSDCRNAHCGDAVKDSDEDCDDGDSGDLPDDCPSTCEAPVCGDGHQWEGHEACDDGNTEDGDDCSADCLRDLSDCGNLEWNPGEECDGGDLHGTSCVDLNYSSGVLACDVACHFDTSGCHGLCGNRVIQPDEGCDDGNTTAADGCSDTCQVEAGWSCTGAVSVCTTVCGDDIVVGAEECDNGAANSDTAADACRTDCRTPWCGDDVQDTGEQCDDGVSNSDTVANACRTDCRVAWCGDGVLDTGEQCDEGTSNSNTQADACRTDCHLPSCGDGVIDTGEQCDEGDIAPGDGCDASCLWEPILNDGFCDITRGENASNSPADCDFVILHLTFDPGDRSGLDYYDVSGHGNHGAGTATTTVTSPWGEALSCNGTDSVVNLPQSVMDNLSAFTIELYYRWSGSTWTPNGDLLFGYRDNNEAQFVALQVHNTNHGAVFQAFNNGSTYSLYGAATLNDNQWHHLAGTYDGTTMRLYVDHQPDGELVHSGTIGTNTSQPVLLCNIVNRSYFAEAELDNVRISSRALDPLEFLPPVP